MILILMGHPILARASHMQADITRWPATGPADSTSQQAAAEVLVDPFGIIFDSATGRPVNGARVTLIDAATGEPALVFGDDGISRFPSTITSGGTATDDNGFSGGKVYEFAPGAYRFPFVIPGNYRLEVMPPAGYKAPSGVSTKILQNLPGGPFAIVEPGSRGETFRINPGAALQLDVAVDPAASGLWLTKTAGKDSVAVGDLLQYRLEVENITQEIVNEVVVSDRLPLGFRYQPDSTSLNGARGRNPSISADGRTLTFSLGDMRPNTPVDIRYVTVVGARTKTGKATNQAVASGAGPVISNSAAASVQVNEDLFRSKNILVGRVIADNCDNLKTATNDGVEGVRIYLEDGSFVFSDAEGMFHFEGVRPGTHVVQLDLDSLPQDYEMAPCGQNTRLAGRSFSQFVDLQPGTLWRTDFHVTLKPKAMVSENIEPSGPGTETHPKTAQAQGDLPRGSLRDGILAPADGMRLSSSTGAVRVRLDAALTPRLLLDEQEISADKIGFRQKNSRTGKNLYNYVGVNFGAPGPHTLELHGIGAFGIVRFKQTLNLVRTGDIAAIRVVETAGNIADGKTPITVRLALLDTSGQEISAPAELEIRGGNLKPFQKYRHPLGDISDKWVYVDASGFVYFQPSNTAGLYTAVLGYKGIELEVQTRVQPDLRDWILVGLAEGSAGYNMISGNRENLKDADIHDAYYSDGRAAFFAKGKVSAKWLLTMAYDTDRTRSNVGNSLFQTIDPDTYYTLYGDGSQQDYDAASANKLYLKIERDQFYALFGDYQTGLTVTELSRYNRSFSGFKSELKTENYSLNMFASDTDQAFIKDEIQGDGTSGLYHLSRQNIVINSEKITIETRDRFRSEVIVSSRGLTRHIDYNIDYDAGTLFFKEPIFSRDERFNPIFIVVDYESNDQRDKAYTYGGRAAARLLEGKLELGASVVQEGQIGAKGELYGLDAAVQISPNTTLKTEIATSDTDTVENPEDGSAFIAELKHRSQKLDGSVYVRQQDQGFGLGQQKGSETGTRKMGADGTYRINRHVDVSGQAYRQSNLSSDAERDLGELKLTVADDINSVYSGLRHAEDRMGDGSVRRSNQVITGARRKFLDNRLKLRLDHDQSLGNDNANPDFPTRTTLGADYRLARPVTLFAEQEFTWGENEDTQGTRVGLRTTPWKGGQVGSSLERQYRENGERILANLGLDQAWKINPNWSVSGGLDHSRTVKKPGDAPFNVNVPPSSGSANDFTAVSLGTAYRQEKWSWTSRLETRLADDGDKWGVTSGIYGEIKDGLALSAGTQIFYTDAENGMDETSADIRLGLALRPRNSRWTILDRLDFILDDQNGDGLELQSRRIVNNLNANCKLNRKIQLSLQHGAKYVMETLDEDPHSGVTDLIGIESRYDLTDRWDIGLQAGLLHAWSADQFDYSTGMSVGYNVIDNMWVSLGYNWLGFEDADFSQGSFTAQGPFVRFRMKFDQQTAKDMAQWASEKIALIR